ncbi:unnamed protein product [Mesocestoides corti]|uniref:Uncharacterized protein n=1 Tax=Mesocestoides corti TaxID=53468 RepID=A0A0R3UCH8_MESCO|nr:unnamed protein product [Mesocestoides corti]
MSGVSKGAYALLLMAGYWITEVIPIYVTAMLPLAMAPLMGLLPSGVACREYMHVSYCWHCSMEDVVVGGKSHRRDCRLVRGPTLHCRRVC